MTDVHEPNIRSYNMSQIKGKNTKPEILVRKYLFANGLRYRIHANRLPGKPDITLRKYNTVIFVHGCFWHGHDRCKYFKIPQTRTEWWKNKIYENKTNDKKNIDMLRKDSWKVIIVWECQLRPSTRQSTLKKLIKKIV